MRGMGSKRCRFKVSKRDAEGIERQKGKAGIGRQGGGKGCWEVTQGFKGVSREGESKGQSGKCRGK